MLDLGKLGFGAGSLGNLGRRISDADAADAVQAALASGIRYFDTAPLYGFGLSERRLGDAVRGVPDVIVSSKVGRLLVPDALAATESLRDGFSSPMPFRSEYDYSYDGVMRSYEASLQRLGLARIDILFVHDIGRRTHGANHERHWRALFEGGYRALDELRSRGDITAIGLGVNEWEACVEAMNEAQFDLFLLAGRYTLLDQGALALMLPKVASHGARVVMAGVYNSGILATGSAGDPHFDYAPAAPAIISRTQAIEAVCAKFDVPLAAAALQFVLAHPLAAAVIPGIASSSRVFQTRALVDYPIPAAFWSSLKDLALIAEAAPVPQHAVGLRST